MNYQLVSFWLLFFLVGTPVGWAEEFPTDLGKWYQTKAPERGSEQALLPNGNKHSWFVKPGNPNPQVRLLPRKYEGPKPLLFESKLPKSIKGRTGRRFLQKVADGWIVGFNKGEFGASVWWFSPEGEKGYHISDDQIVSFVDTKSGLFAFEGIAHGSTSEGGVIRLSRNEKGRWIASPWIPLGAAPEAVYMEKDSIVLVATTAQLLRVYLVSKNMDVLVDEAFWQILYPTSIAVDQSGRIYVGMRKGVAKVEKKDGKYELFWLMPSKEYAEREFSEELKEGFR